VFEPIATIAFLRENTTTCHVSFDTSSFFFPNQYGGKASRFGILTTAIQVVVEVGLQILFQQPRRTRQAFEISMVRLVPSGEFNERQRTTKQKTSLSSTTQHFGLGVKQHWAGSETTTHQGIDGWSETVTKAEMALDIEKIH